MNNNHRYNNWGKPSAKRITLPLFIYKNSLYRKVINLGRPRNNKYLSGTKSKSSYNSKFNLRILFPVMVLGLVLFITFNIGKFFNLTPIPYGTSIIDLHNVDNRLTIIFLGLDDRVKDYVFADLVVLMDINLQNNIAKLYTINSGFSSPGTKGYSLRSSLNSSSEDSIGEFIKQVEGLTGIKIDNYFAMNKRDLMDMFKNSHLSIDTSSNMILDGRVINRGEKVKIADVIDLTIGYEKRNADLLFVQQLFLKTYLDEFKNKIYLYSQLVNPDKFINTFKSGFHKQDFINFLFTLSNLEIVTSVQSIMTNELGSPSELDSTILNPNYLNLDENIVANFRDFEVVKEQAQIEIYNATNQSGLASTYRRLIQNRGGVIIKPGNYSELMDSSRIYIDIKNVNNYRNTINLIQDLLEKDVRIFDISEYKYNYSGDIIIILGKDILN